MRIHGMPPHKCDQGCVCPVHNTPLIYSPAADEHACQDVDCKYGHGLESKQIEEMRAELEERYSRVPVEQFLQERLGRWTEEERS